MNGPKNLGHITEFRKEGKTFWLLGKHLLKIFFKNLYFFSDPDMAHELFTTKFEVFHERERNPILGNPDTSERMHTFRARGKRWKRLRTLSNPAFSVQNLKKVFLYLKKKI